MIDQILKFKLCNMRFISVSYKETRTNVQQKFDPSVQREDEVTKKSQAFVS